MTIFDVISLFGGLALFLYGMRVMGNGLKEGSSGALKGAMEKVTNNPFVGFLLGVAVTALVQSSTATIVLTSGLVGAGVITLRQSLGVIIGANVGTTVTGQIIRLLDLDAGGGASWVDLFKPSSLAPLAAITGILLLLAIHTKHSDVAGQVAMGFAILFTGLLNMTAAVSPLSGSAAFAQTFVRLADTPVLGFLVGAGVAFLLQSSSATIGILQALSMTGALTFGAVWPIIIGVNIGDCVTTAIVCAIGSRADAKRTGVVHILFNAAGSVLVVLGMIVLRRAGRLDALWDTAVTSGVIANAHTAFRVISALALLPVCGRLEALSRILVKDDPQRGESVERELERLDEKLLASPALALSGAEDAITAMARLARGAVRGAMDVLRAYDAGAVETINENEDRLDLLADRVDDYLIRLSPRVTTGRGSELLNYYIQCFSEFERIGDHAVNLTENARELLDRGASLSPAAQRELDVLRAALDEVLGYACQSFSALDMHAARRIEPVEEVVDDLIAACRANHVKRLREGGCTAYAGVSYLDILVNVERISDQCSNLGVYTLALSDSAILSDHHGYLRRLHQGQDAEYNRRYAEAREKYFGALENPEREA